MDQIRQGDVLLVRLAAPPPGTPAEFRLIEREAGQIVLAWGELTGHRHAIAAPQATHFEHRASGRCYLRVHASVATLEHEEHATVELPAGSYEVVRQRQYGPEAPAGEQAVGD